MKSIEDSVKNIYESIDNIIEINPLMGQIFHQSFAVAANTIEKIAEKDGEHDDNTDISEYIKMLNDIFGVSLEEVVLQAMRANGMEVMSEKEADEATLDFITSDEDLDDYERFLKQNQAKENLDFLKKEI